MPVDHAAAETFIWSAARLVDRHRYTMLFEDGAVEPVIAAIAAYRNPDGGFGHALEPDLRCPQSQPAATLSALETLHEARRLDSVMASGARVWLAQISARDGGIPSALPGFESYPHSPWWSAEPGSMLTFALAGVLHAGRITGDDWLERATGWCWRAIDDANRKPTGYWLKFACAFLDAVPDEDRARAALASLQPRIDPASFAPAAGTEGERLRPLDISPRPRSRSRALFSDADIEAHLDEVENGQQADGGWMFDWLAWSPEQTSAWRGFVTIRALTWLRDNGRSIRPDV
ncbi:MAG TPA: hypothetical protein VMG37_15425 [Solirubrobacteraceae bacterium]|nr:hypothetical protein [Solirubrobacteraceae bacterium]